MAGGDNLPVPAEATLPQLQEISRADNSPYWEGRNAQAYQARHHELLAERDELAAANATLTSDLDEPEPAYGVPQVNPAADALAAVIDVIHPDEREHFSEWMGALSHESALAINAELHRENAGELTIAGPVSAQELHEAAQSSDGAVLVEEWGRDAAYKFALVRERLARIIADFEDEDVVAFADALTPGESLAIMRALARG